MTVGIFIDPRRRASETMFMFAGVAGFVRDKPPEAGRPAQSGQASARRPSAREGVSKRPRIRLSNSGGATADAGSSRGAVCAASRSLQSGIQMTSTVDSIVIVADDEVQPVETGVVAQSSIPLAMEVLDGPSQDRSTLTPVSSPSALSVGLETSSGAGQKEASSGSSSAQFFARNISVLLDQVKKRVASNGQASALERRTEVLELKVEEVLTLLRRLQPSEAKKAIAELESKCARCEGNLESAVLEIEGLKKEKAALAARVEELEEENRRRRSSRSRSSGFLFRVYLFFLDGGL
ncbi:hypothetical protein AXF42_Ash000747 [Apostasia shenzhenica]|uniref:Uncharacterized protein n=1 Tax=Apostasia shenzhenica TaxID=1088818 RepID=A0A2I0AH75_9ASPA|nr:hypothetical protein AXF42_Ash000747 [Apostasia shenzhenica]